MESQIRIGIKNNADPQHTAWWCLFSRETGAGETVPLSGPGGGQHCSTGDLNSDPDSIVICIPPSPTCKDSDSSGSLYENVSCADHGGLKYWLFSSVNKFFGLPDLHCIRNFLYGSFHDKAKKLWKALISTVLWLLNNVFFIWGQM